MKVRTCSDQWAVKFSEYRAKELKVLKATKNDCRCTEINKLIRKDMVVREWNVCNQDFWSLKSLVMAKLKYNHENSAWGKAKKTVRSEIKKRGKVVV